MSFNPPGWAAQPTKSASLQVLDGGAVADTIAVDDKPYYTFGRDKGACDVILTHDGASRAHAAIVHHTDGRIYLIDLGSTRGTRMDGKTLEKYKPTQVYHGSQILFGGGSTYQLVSPETGERAAKPDGEVRASHLLVKHKDVRRPSSWKEPVITRTQDEALAMIEAFREQLTSGQAEFADLASRESHCSSAQRGGDLGWFGPGKMQAAFERATFALQVGELSGPVFSDSGVHLILRTG